MKRGQLAWKVGSPALLLCVLLTCSTETVAATLTVTDCGDTTPGGAAGQLRRLITDAAPGDAIVIPGCTITLTGAAGDDANQTGDLDILKDLTITGAGAISILDGAKRDRVLEIHTGAHATVVGLVIRNGDSYPPGGGLANHGTLSLASVTVTENTSVYGGGIANDGTMTAEASTVTGNGAGGYGGGIENTGILTLARCTVRQNTSNYGSAGVDSFGTLVVTDSSISQNYAFSGVAGGVGNYGQARLERVAIRANWASNAGGFYNSSSLTLVNVTISANIAAAMSGLGGGIYNAAAGTASLSHVTIAENGATQGNAIRNEGTLRVRSTIVAGACWGTITSDGHNLDSGTSCGLAGPADLSAVDPGLGSFVENSGPTGTHPLNAGSPAIDAADDEACAATDQRGVARPQGPACDIGAYELRGPTSFYTLPPCRLADTRAAEGPALAANSTRAFDVTGRCGVPPDAAAVALNVTTVDATAAGNLRLYAEGDAPPGTSTVNFVPFLTRANNAIIPLGHDGAVAVLLTSAGTTHLVMDVSGYFR